MAATTATPDMVLVGCYDGMNGIQSTNLNEAMHVNETSTRRCIGLTVETKPDWFMVSTFKEFRNGQGDQNSGKNRPGWFP